MDYDDENNYENNYGMEQNNEMEENINDNFDEINDINNDEYDGNFNEDYNEYNQEDQDNDLDNENQNFNENDLYDMNMENIKLKDQMQKILIQKNNEMINMDLNYKNKIMQMNQALNKYKAMAQNYNKLQKEILTKNKIISELQQGNNDNNNISFNDNSNIIFTIIKKIKAIQQDILEEPDSDFINQEEYQKIPQENQIKMLFNDMNILSQKLIEYKNNNMKEIIQLRNLLDSTDINQKNAKDIKDQFYLKFIDLIKNLPKNNINNIKFPNYSINDNDEIRKNNIINSIRALIDHIINNNMNMNINNKNMDQELSKRLKEMSELLNKNNQNLSLSTKNYNEIKIKYNELKKEYDAFVNQSDLDKKKLINDLNKKNQEIKSLEHINTKLSNQINENKINEESKNNKKPALKYGRIKNKINKKNKEENIGNINLNEEKFIKDKIMEKTLEKFLNKYSNGEYDNYIKDIKDKKENIDLDNLKNDIEKFNIKINKDLEDEK